MKKGDILFMEIVIKDCNRNSAETEMYIRELELANDGLQDENEELRKEINELQQALKKASTMKSDQLVAEMKRDILDALEKMPAEKIRDMVVDIAFEVLEEGVQAS